MFAKRLKDLREEKDVTQKVVADYLGISDRGYGYYESGERFPPQNILVKIADYFNVSIDYLLCRTNIKNPPLQVADNDSVYAAHRDDGYDKPLDPETLAYINKAVEEAFKKREEWLKKRNKPHKGK